MLERLGEEWIRHAEDDGRRGLAPGTELRHLLKVGVVYGEERTVVAAVAQRPDQAVKRRAEIVTKDICDIRHERHIFGETSTFISWA